MTSGSGGSPPQRMPADRTRALTPSSDSRRASSAAAIGDRQTFAVHSTAMSPVSRMTILPDISLHLHSVKQIRTLCRGIFRNGHNATGTRGFYLPSAWRRLISCGACRKMGSLRRLSVDAVPATGHAPIREKVIMTEFGTEPSFRTYLQVLRRRKWWVSVAAALGLAAALAFSLTAHKQYSATAQLLV